MLVPSLHLVDAFLELAKLIYKQPLRLLYLLLPNADSIQLVEVVDLLRRQQVQHVLPIVVQLAHGALAEVVAPEGETG